MLGFALKSLGGFIAWSMVIRWLFLRAFDTKREKMTGSDPMSHHFKHISRDWAP